MSQDVPRNGTEAVPYIGMHHTVGRAALLPPIRLDDLYPKQKDQLPITTVIARPSGRGNLHCRSWMC